MSWNDVNPVQLDERQELGVGDPDDASVVFSYFLAPESADYKAIMSVLDASASAMTPSEVCYALRESGKSIPENTVEARLEQLRNWGAASGRSDHTHARRVQDLIARSFRYSATWHGRRVQRFYESVFVGSKLMREIPLLSLNTVVTSLDALVRPGSSTAPEWVNARINEIFTAHDDLDASMVGAEDALMNLAERFDLDNENTGELKQLLVNYATRVAKELDRAADRSARALKQLQPRFSYLAELAVSESSAADLIGRDILSASKGGAVKDWEDLAQWFDPARGRAARFNSRVLGAISTFHTNVRRLHTSGDTGTARSRALLLARACLDEQFGSQLFIAALGDHSWRKLHTEAEEPDSGRIPPWRGGPQVVVPNQLRTLGKAGVRGRAPAPIDDSEDRKQLEKQRLYLQMMYRQHLREIFAAEPGALLSDGAARVAYRMVCIAMRRPAVSGVRNAEREGLECSLFWTGTATGVIRSPNWSILVPGREIVLHAKGTPATRPQNAGEDPGDRPEIRFSAGGAA